MSKMSKMSCRGLLAFVCTIAAFLGQPHFKLIWFIIGCAMKKAPVIPIQLYLSPNLLQSSNRHMDHRTFGRELTNLADQHLRAKRNYSFLHNDKPKDPKSSLSVRNTSHLMPALKPLEPKTTLSDPQMVPDYFEQNLSHLRAQESKSGCLGNYISDHKTVSENSRAKLIDWLSQLHYKYKMFPETMFSMVYFLDRYLSAKAVPLGELQLVGMAALLISAKFEQTYQVPKLRQLISASAGQYTPSQLLNMEADMLQTFNFELTGSTAFQFYGPLARVAELGEKNAHLGQYVLEVALTRARYLQYPSSLLACSAIYLIKKIRRADTAWGQNLAKLAGYQEGDLKSCAKDLCSLLEDPHPQNCRSITKKFSLPAFHEVAKIKLERRK